MVSFFLTVSLLCQQFLLSLSFFFFLVFSYSFGPFSLDLSFLSVFPLSFVMYSFAYPSLVASLCPVVVSFSFLFFLTFCLFSSTVSFLFCPPPPPPRTVFLRSSSSSMHGSLVLSPSYPSPPYATLSVGSFALLTLPPVLPVPSLYLFFLLLRSSSASFASLSFCIGLLLLQCFSLSLSLSPFWYSFQRWYPCCRVSSPIVFAIVCRFLFSCSGFVFLSWRWETQCPLPSSGVYALSFVVLSGVSLTFHSSGCFRLLLKFLVLASLPRVVL